MTFADRMLREGWLRAREQNCGCPACGSVYAPGSDPRSDRDKCWLSPAETITRKGKDPIQRPPGWKVLCAGQFTVGNGPAVDDRYVFDPDMQPEKDFNRQYILRDQLEAIQAGQQQGDRRATRRRNVRRSEASRNTRRFSSKLDAGTEIARPADGDQAERAQLARGLWDRAEDNHLIDLYLRARRRNADTIREMTSLRFLPDCPFGEDADDGERRTLKLPALLMPVTNADHEVVAVHRIAIRSDGQGKSDAIGNAKQLLGSPLPGTWIDIAGDDRGNGGIAVACEGPETGWAIAEATGYRVLVCVSTSGLWNLELPADLVGEGDGQIRTLVIAADADAEAWRALPDAGGGRLERSHDAWRDTGRARQAGMSGQRVARDTAWKLRQQYPGLRVGLAFPRQKGLTKFDEHARVRADRQPGEWVPVDPDVKSVDFEDVANGDGSEKGATAGRKRVATLIKQAADAAVAIRRDASQPGGDGDAGGGGLPPLDIRRAAAGGDDERVMPSLKRDTIEMFVGECFGSPEPGRAGGAAYRLVWLRQKWWKHDGRVWIEMTDEELRGTLERWLATLGTYKTVKMSYEDKVAAAHEDAEMRKHLDDGVEVDTVVNLWVKKQESLGNKLENIRWMRLCPNTRLINELLDTLRGEVHVPALELPGYLQPTYADNGDAIGYEDDHGRRMLTGDEAEAEGLPDLRRSVMYANGTMPIDSILAGEPELVPHDERLLSMSGMPVAWPREATMAIRRGDIDGWLHDNCPHFIAHLDHIDESNKGAKDALVRHHGASIGMLNGDQIGMWCFGESGSGKGTLMNAFAAQLGDSMLLGMRLDQLCEQDYLIGVEGKRAAVINEADGVGVANKPVTEILKGLFRNEPMRARELYSRVVTFTPSARWWLNSNELIRMRDLGNAFARSVIFVEFPEGVRGTETQSQSYERRILAEVQASLVYCVWHGLRPYVIDVQHDRRPIRPPARHAESANVFGAEANEFGRFVDDHIEYAGVEEHEGTKDVPWLSVEVLHEAFSRSLRVTPEQCWLKRSGVTPKFKAVRSRAVHRDRKSAGPAFGNRRVSAFEGVKFKDGSIAELWHDDAGSAPHGSYSSSATPTGPSGPMWPVYRG